MLYLGYAVFAVSFLAFAIAVFAMALSIVKEERKTRRLRKQRVNQSTKELFR